MIDTSRRLRMATGSGVEPADVSSLVRHFEVMTRLVRQMAVGTGPNEA
jgi:signal recognition particle GTPase